MPSKLKLRQAFIEKRSHIKAEYREKAAKLAAQQFVETAIFRVSKKIACYLPFRNEFDTNALIESIWQSQKSCYLPVLTLENTLIFVRYQFGDALIHNRYNILEPKKREHQIPAKDLDIVLTPLIAFDEHGTRLGTGGGYYDRTFAFLKDQSDVNLKPAQRETLKLIGLAFAEQKSTVLLPQDPWDISLQAVLTEEGLSWFK